jgi:hypothetical protein
MSAIGPNQRASALQMAACKSKANRQLELCWGYGVWFACLNMKTQIAPARSGYSKRASIRKLMLQRPPQITTQRSRGSAIVLKS